MPEYTIDDATHELECSHCLGRARTNYTMPCVLLGYTDTGNAKVQVFGDRYWRGRSHISRVRYVKPERLVPRKAKK